MKRPILPLTFILLILTSTTLLPSSPAPLNQNTQTHLHPNSSAPKISLLTCSEMSDMYASFGHSAIRIQNPASGEDIVYDYGIFNFSEPNFIWKFLRGNLLYWVGKRDFNHFMASYQRDGREVKEDILDITESQAQKIIYALEENLKPENKYYKYDFINDNCATRIRDMLISDDFTFNDTLTGVTFRNNFDYYLNTRKWMQLGVDLLLGTVADEEMTRSDEMYLPFALSTNLAEISFEGESILHSSEILFPGRKMEIKRSSSAFQPWFVLTACFLLSLLLFFWKKELLAKVRPYIYGLVVIMSIVVLFMWFASSHDATSNNWNILWINPLYIFLIFGAEKPWKRTLSIILSALALSVILFGWLLPQQFNPASFPFIATLIILNLNYLNLKSQRFLKSS